MASVESVVHYRLLGRDHPAATGERLLGSFSGETILVSKFIATLIQKHYINDSAYKLEVRARSVGSSDAAGTLCILHPHDIIHNYDQLEITIVKKQFADAAKEFQKGSEFSSLTPSDLPMEDATGGLIPHRSSETKAETQDEWMLRRLQALLKKSLPVCPGRVLQEGEMNNDSEASCVCLLCDLPAVDGIKLHCCRFKVCKSCNLSASTALNNNQCPVCGTPTRAPRRNNSGSAYSLGNHGISGTYVKSEVSGESVRDITMKLGSAESIKVEGRGYPFDSRPAFDTNLQTARWPEGHYETKPLGGASTSAGHGISALGTEVTDFLKTLEDSLDRSLSMLDLPDPLPEEYRRKRKRSAILDNMDRTAKQREANARSHYISASLKVKSLQ